MGKMDDEDRKIVDLKIQNAAGQLRGRIDLVEQGVASRFDSLAQSLEHDLNDVRERQEEIRTFIDKEVRPAIAAATKDRQRVLTAVAIFSGLLAGISMLGVDLPALIALIFA